MHRATHFYKLKRCKFSIFLNLVLTILRILKFEWPFGTVPLQYNDSDAKLFHIVRGMQCQALTFEP